MVLPKLKRHLNAKNTLSDPDSINGHRNLSETERPMIAQYRNLNAQKICKLTVLTACGMDVVKWESSVIDLRIWDK